MASIVLGGTPFTVEPLFASDSFELQPRVMPILLALFRAQMTIVDAAGGKIENLGDLKVDISLVGPVLDQLAPIAEQACRNLPRGELKLLLRDVLKTSTANGIPLFGAPTDIGGQTANPFELIMRGRTLDTWKLLIFALRTHYPDFQGAFAAIGSAAKAATAAPSEASTTSPPSQQATG